MVYYFSLFLWAKGCYTKNTPAEDFDLSTGTVYSTNLWPLNPTCGCEGTTINTDRNDSESLERTESANKQTPGHVSLSTLLEFAIGAAECLELMHHGLKTVHGEIRGDAFYLNQKQSIQTLGSTFLAAQIHPLFA